MTLTDPLLSPKDLATAIGASESSLRRWIDDGDIRISRTAGGHRRIPRSEAVQFIRRMGAVVIRPEALNLPPLPALIPRSGEPAPASDEDQLFTALRDGQREVARGLVLSWYLRGQALHALFDGPLRGALHRVGELWAHDQRGILVEHHATDTCLAIITTLRALLPAADDSAPLAIGGAPRGDPYQIPTLMAAAVLAEAGLRDVNFGADTPLQPLGAEAARCGARIVWLSISAFGAGDAELGHEIGSLATILAANETELVVGGSASAARAPRAAMNTTAIDTMGELAAYARRLPGRGPALRPG